MQRLRLIGGYLAYAAVVPCPQWRRALARTSLIVIIFTGFWPGLAVESAILLGLTVLAWGRHAIGCYRLSLRDDDDEPQTYDRNDIFKGRWPL